MFKIERNLQPSIFGDYFRKVSQIHSKTTRSSENNLLYLPKYRTNRLQRSVKFIGVKIWNNVPNHFKHLSSYLLFQKYHKSYLIASYENWFYKLWYCLHSACFVNVNDLQTQCLALQLNRNTIYLYPIFLVIGGCLTWRPNVIGPFAVSFTIWYLTSIVNQFCWK